MFTASIDCGLNRIDFVGRPVDLANDIDQILSAGKDIKGTANFRYV